ncbi:MAG: rhomboid family intramembrane serine protease [Acidobacteria bacterium]|nr:MAG: rhomboid family intramembrane serine protease [Acidobacteriota bacterium]
MTQDPTTAAPACYRHPDRHTLLKCSRCDRPICAACSIDASVGQRCPECVRSEGTQEIIPTGARSSRASGAPATKTFIALAVGFFALTGFGQSGDLIFETLAQWNLAVAAGEWWRIFTPILLHASITHILFNMWALWVLGPQIERGVGTWPFVSLFLASAGVGGAFAFYLGDPLDVAVGASGAIFGLFGVWLSWAMHRRNTMQGRAMLRQIGVLLLINAAIPFLVPNISWQAHLGGLIAGFAIGEIWSRLRGSNIEVLRTVTGVAVAVVAALSVMI